VGPACLDIYIWDGEDVMVNGKAAPSTEREKKNMLFRRWSCGYIFVEMAIVNKRMYKPMDQE
jgi:hypothetical protein